ncbi:MAG: DUF1206 domain-containing protein [Desertifilum sp. SIO1I2]|nr:DUF1206 domain-containing protein [Desertifilum sp. SIO1I2]
MWVERLARFGFAAKGIVYAVIGILAVMAATNNGGETTDANGALEAIALQPFGQILLSAIAIGLFGYVLWRFVQAIFDPERHGTDAKGIAQRLGFAVSGAIYLGFAWTAIQLVIGAARHSEGNATQDWTARILAQPFGQWLVGLGGVLMIGLGFYQFYQAYKAKFRGELNWHHMSAREKTWATRLGRLGISSRGVVYALIGIFLIQAARSSNPNEARGVDGALQALSQQPYGKWLLLIVALGFIAYGVYMGVEARYRRINPPDMAEKISDKVSSSNRTV